MIMDCSIVRTMKAMREVSYNDLVAKIPPQVRLLSVEISLIKKRIERH